ncbi:MAG: Flp pilus assembly protein CpaB [Gemmataceae bacterium]
MRASTMFAMTLALLAGVGAVVATRSAGWFNKADAPKEKEKEIQVLAAARNLFPGDLIDASYVKVRPLRPEEREDYEKNKASYLPAVTTAVTLRVAKNPIEADAPIRREDLKEMVKPDPLHQRLLPNMRAVNISVQKDQSAGGLIQEGEWVDVYLTSNITANGQETTRTATLATGLRVIAKRNTLFQVLAPLPDNKPVHFTLEANPYRAALIEYGKTKGAITLVPISAAEQKELEQKRKAALQANLEHLPVQFTAADESTIAEEEDRVEAFTRGEMPIGTADLIRIFDLKTPPPPQSALLVESFSGLKRTATTHFSPEGEYIGTDLPKRAGIAANTSRTRGRNQTADASSFNFSAPGCSTPSKECKSCKK